MCVYSGWRERDCKKISFPQENLESILPPGSNRGNTAWSTEREWESGGQGAEAECASCEKAEAGPAGIAPTHPQAPHIRAG